MVLVCEHASNRVPGKYRSLGLDAETLESHVAWDPGAQAVAEIVADRLNAPLVQSTVSRLVYDCNRPPEAAGAMPAQSEHYHIPGNRNLTHDQRTRRIHEVYHPFRDMMSATLQSTPGPVALITIHSFTPVFMGRKRDVQIGILHDNDSRLADAMIETAPGHTDLTVRRNDPYGPEDGVTHTLREHGLKNGLPNVMIEIRNDLIATPQSQARMAGMIADWLKDSLQRISHPEENDAHSQKEATCRK